MKEIRKVRGLKTGFLGYLAKKKDRRNSNVYYMGVVAYPEICFVAVQQIYLRADRKWGLGAVAP
jgi:hypothetical protein